MLSPTGVVQWLTGWWHGPLAKVQAPVEALAVDAPPARNVVHVAEPDGMSAVMALRAEAARISQIKAACSGKHAELEVKAITHGWPVEIAKLHVERALADSSNSNQWNPHDKSSDSIAS